MAYCSPAVSGNGLDQGIAEEGMHQEIMRLDGMYAKMYQGAQIPLAIKVSPRLYTAGDSLLWT